MICQLMFKISIFSHMLNTVIRCLCKCFITCLWWAVPTEGPGLLGSASIVPAEQTQGSELNTQNPCNKLNVVVVMVPAVER